MGGSKKSKRISWAFNLSQVRLFSSSDPPSKVGMCIHDQLKAKSLQLVVADDDAPPGFPSIQPIIPLTKWRCPPRFAVNKQWQVVSGEESKEIKDLSQREARAIEAFYPRLSTIPPNPCELMDVKHTICDDGDIPVVPITPIEDSYATLDATSINCDQRNLIDYDLLTRILSNPTSVEQLIATLSASGMNTSFTTTQCIANLNQPPKNPFSSTDPMPCTRSEYKAPPVVKDVNYYRNLVQQYGGQKQNDVLPQPDHRYNQAIGTHEEHFNFMRSRSPRIMQPCVYFNTSRGCRNGVNCVYQHDILGKREFKNCILEVKRAKRMKLDREITS